MRARTLLLSFVLLLGSASMLICQTGKNSGDAKEIEQEQHNAYVRLSNQIYSNEHPESQQTHVSDKDQVAAMVSRMEAIVRDQIAATLASKNHSPAEVIKAISGVQGGLALSADPGLGETNTPFADLSELKGAPTLAVAYTILRGAAGIPDSLPILEFYTQTSGRWELKGTAPPDLTTSRFFVRRMDAGLSGEVWYLAWGNRLGDSGTRLGIFLYAFDGTTVRTVWKRDELTRGTMDEVTRKSIKFSYEKVYHSGERTEETFYVTPNGLQ